MYALIRFYNNTRAFEILHLFEESSKAITVAKRYAEQRYGKENICKDMTVKTNLISNNILSYITPYDTENAIIYAVLFLPAYVSHDKNIPEPFEIYYDNRYYILPDDYLD